jgi:hypothetical protein
MKNVLPHPLTLSPRGEGGNYCFLFFKKKSKYTYFDFSGFGIFTAEFLPQLIQSSFLVRSLLLWFVTF